MITMNPDSRHGEITVVNGGTSGFHNENFRVACEDNFGIMSWNRVHTQWMEGI